MKNLLIAMLTLITAAAFGQEKLIKTAESNLKKGKLDKAKIAIDTAIVNPETENLYSTWFLKAQVYAEIAASEKYKTLAEDAEMTALAAYNKARELDSTQVDFTIMRDNRFIQVLANDFYNRGAGFYGKKDFKNAGDAFAESIDLYRTIGVVDTGTLFNTGLCYELAGELEKAKPFYEELYTYNYKQSSIYGSLATIYRTEKDDAKAVAVAEEGYKKYPDDYNAMLNASNINILSGHTERAQQILNGALEKWGDNEQVLFSIGIANEQANNIEEAIKFYQKAIDKSPKYYDANLNMGAIYVNRAIETQKTASNLPLNESAKYDEMMTAASQDFTKAIPYLEVAIEVRPDNINAMTILRDIYVHNKQMDKAEELTKKIDAAKK